MNTKELPPLPTLPQAEVEEWSESGITFRGEGWKKETVEKYATAYAIAAIEAQGVPDGWQLVPKEPTDAMVREALHLDLSYMPGHDGPDRAAVYKAMLASAPPAPQASEVQQEPVAWMYDWVPAGSPTSYDWISSSKEEVFAPENAYFNIRPLYPQPAQQAKPQPLSDEQIDEEWFSVHNLNINNVAKARLFARAIEAAHGIQGSAA